MPKYTIETDSYADMRCLMAVNEVINTIDHPFWDDELVSLLETIVDRMQFALEHSPKQFEDNLQWAELTSLVDSLPLLSETLLKLGVKPRSQKS